MKPEARIHAKCLNIKRDDLERFLIKEHGLPKDIVITNIGGHPGNQEAWQITVQSDSFDPVWGLDVIPSETITLYKDAQ